MDKEWYQKHPLRWDMFNAHDAEYDWEINFYRLYWAFGLLFPTAGAVVAISVISAWLIIPVVMFALMLCYVGPTLGRRHPLNKIPKRIPDTNPHYSGLYKKANPLRKLAERYWDSPAEDKRMFPSNIVELLASPDLVADQRASLEAEMDRVFKAIDTRNAVRKAALANNVDISSVLEYMQDQRRGTQIEIDTYKELM